MPKYINQPLEEKAFWERILFYFNGKIARTNSKKVFFPLMFHAGSESFTDAAAYGWMVKVICRAYLQIFTYK